MNLEDNKSQSYYIIERRKIINGKIIIEDPNCYITDTLNNVKKWINDNKDFDDREFLWYWAVHKIKINDKYGSELYKVYNWDGIELDKQPIHTLYIMGDVLYHWDRIGWTNTTGYLECVKAFRKSLLNEEGTNSKIKRRLY